MELTLTLAEILTASKALEEVKENKDLNGFISYRLNSWSGKLGPILKTFEETRNKLIKEKYGVESTTQPGIMEVPKESMADFLVELGTVLSQEEKIEMTTLKPEDFKDVKVSPNFFNALSKFIVE